MALSRHVANVKVQWLPKAIHCNDGLGFWVVNFTKPLLYFNTQAALGIVIYSSNKAR